MKNLLFLNNKSQTKIFNDVFFTKGQLAPDKNENEDLDQQIHNYLIEQSSDEINSFTLPISLNENFLEFSGLIFAHHIRLTTQLKYREATIVFYGILELEELLRLTEWARVLLTANVLYFNISKYSFENIKECIKNYKPKNPFPTNLLEKIQIQRPVNYNDGHHSIDNEFALIQWSQHINCYDQLPINFKNEFDSRLFFKFLKMKSGYFTMNNSSEDLSIIAGNSKVLLIDDESRKGWETFYKKLIKVNAPENFNCSEINFKEAQEQSEILNKIETKLKDFNPDVVLLDLRLHDYDFSEHVTPENLTGMKILDKIKEINRGIQVIVTTASNKAWNFNLAKQKGCFDFIIKNGYDSPEKTINNLNASLIVGTSRAQFLKKIDEKISALHTLILKNHHLDDTDDFEKEPNQHKEEKIRKAILSNIQLAFELLDNGYKISHKEKYLTYSYLQFFILIEDFVNPYSENRHNPIIFEENYQFFVHHTIKNVCFIQKKNDTYQTLLTFDKKYKIAENIKKTERRMDTNFLVSALLIYKFGNSNSSVEKWPDIIKTRNNVAHEGYTPNETEFLNLLNFINYLFNNLNEKDTNLERGLMPLTFEDSIKELQMKYNSR